MKIGAQATFQRSPSPNACPPIMILVGRRGAFGRARHRFVDAKRSWASFEFEK
jgi:hypothetical protein